MPDFRVHVHLLSYRRPALLRRAIASLRAQTMSDWTCELHNDAPEDPSPAALVHELADSRFSLHTHPRNLGAVATFNLAHVGTREPYFSILEDDNWWEPGFLETMVRVLEERPTVEMAWANMRFWRETPGRAWLDTGETIWPVVSHPPLTIAWPQLLQFDGPLYSNGAMLARSAAGAPLQVPPHVPFSLMENLRERAFNYPIVLVPAVLAHFALTLESARAGGHATWAQYQTLMGAAFFKNVPLASAEQARLWQSRRAAVPNAVAPLFFAAFLQPTRGWLTHATAADWWRFLRGCMRHPRTTLAALGARRRHPAIWAELDRATAEACARQQPAADIPPLRLASRSDLRQLTALDK